MSRIKAGTAEKVIAVNGEFVDRDKAVIVGQKYYLKHSDINTRLKDPTFYVVPFMIDGKECWRRPYPINREFDWINKADGTGYYAQITDAHIEGVINEKGDIGKFEKSRETIEVLDLNSGRVSSKPFIKLFPNLIAKSVIDGKFYMIPENRQLADALFKPYDETSSYCREYHQMLSPKRNSERAGYTTFDVRQYGEAGNSAFSVCQKTSDKFWKDNTKKRSVDELEKHLVFPTIGVEFEASYGYINEEDCLNLGLVPVKDGSLEGNSFEYITTVIKENKLNRLLTTTEYINKILSVNKSCSLHAHIGGIKPTEENVVALWMLLYQIDRDLFQILPPYKKAIEYFMSKRQSAKDHCKPMESLNIVKRYNAADLTKNIEEADKVIFKFLNEGVLDAEHNITTRKHIKQGGHKWDQHNRYYALNLMPLYFGKVENSRIEYRLHSGTVNKYKALNWIFICSAITKFVEKNAERILTSKEKITLDDVLIETIVQDDTTEGVFLYDYLTRYIAQRTETNTRMVIRQTDDIYGSEFSNDRSFSFAINGISPFNFEQQKKPIGKSSKKGT